MKVVGLMSGTSLDGVDAALVEIDEPSDRGPAASHAPAPSVRPAWRLLGFEPRPYSPAQREEIHATILQGNAASFARLHARLGDWFADAVIRVCDAAGVPLGELDLVGSHGQTLWHQPPLDGVRGSTLQLGDPATIAERTGVPVVSDFRTRDMAAGGEGAPLVPWVDGLLFATDHVRILQNIGGMANLTWLPPAGSAEPLIAFDTGPGNALIDAAVELATNGEEHLDRDGRWARRGQVDESLLAELLDDPYLRREPPKSTGRETFGQLYVQTLVGRLLPADRGSWADLIATLTALTARSIGRAVREWAPVGEDGEMVVTGGGARNPALMDMLRDALDPVPVRSGEPLGFDPEAKEAIAFAFLAWAHATGRAANVPTVTGATGPRILGSYTPG